MNFALWDISTETKRRQWPHAQAPGTLTRHGVGFYCITLRGHSYNVVQDLEAMLLPRLKL